MGSGSLVPIRRRRVRAVIPAKLLLDPYGRSVTGNLAWKPSWNGAAAAPDAPDPTDSAPDAPRSVLAQSSFDWGGDTPPGSFPGRQRHLRAAREGLHGRAPRRARRRTGHLRRIGPPEGDRLPAGPRGHRGGAAPGPPVADQRGARWRGAHQLLGLRHDRLLRAARRLLIRPARRRATRKRDRRVQGHGQGSARRRHRGPPRRRVQSHRRGQRAGTDVVLPGHRQCRLLPARPWPAAVLRQPHRMRQHH